ncbi:MAG TPA: adenylyl-sulfate kinase [Nannocystis sp.]
MNHAPNIRWHHATVTAEDRERSKGQRGAALWFTGLSGAGKSTVAAIVDHRLQQAGRHSFILDGDNLRHGLCKDLGFAPEDRAENIRRLGEVARLFVEAGLIVLCAAISPYRRDRDQARALVGDGRFIEIFVDTDLAECERRDPKGLYRKARRGEITGFSGIDAPYERPEAPELRLVAGTAGPEALADEVLAHLQARGIVGLTPP